MVEETYTVVDSSTLGILGSIVKTPDTGFGDGAGTHGTGFQGDMEIGAIEAVRVQRPAGLSQDEDFRVGCGIGVLAHTIAGCRHNLSLQHDHSAHRRFTASGGGLGLGECHLHECCRLVHGRPSCTRRSEPPQ